MSRWQYTLSSLFVLTTAVAVVIAAAIGAFGARVQGWLSWSLVGAMLVVCGVVVYGLVLLTGSWAIAAVLGRLFRRRARQSADAVPKESETAE